MATVALEDINEHHNLLDLESVRNFKLPIIFVLGGPGAGKASLCYQFRARYGVTYLSMGTLLRQEASEATGRGRQIAEYVHRQPSQRVPVELTMSILKEALVRVAAAQRPILIQGFPRDFEQVARYEDEVAPIRHVLYLDTSEETSKRRLMERNRLAARFEDDSRIIELRRETFGKEVLPVIENLRKTKRLWELNGNNRKDQVFSDAKVIFAQWKEQFETNISRPKNSQTETKLKFGSQKRRLLTKTEAEIEKNFPSVHYHGPTYDGHY